MMAVDGGLIGKVIFFGIILLALGGGIVGACSSNTPKSPAGQSITDGIKRR
jgi:hypothetical protein